jgi:peptide/nickel transport system ATP-binding protein
MQHPENILEVQDLEISFRGQQGSFAAVKRISFDLRKGETLGIVGESGSGKSVTALSLMQLLPQPQSQVTATRMDFQSPSAGWTPLNSLDQEGIRKFRGKEVSMVFQEPMTSLNPVIRCGDQVVEALRLHLPLSAKEAKARTLELFERVSLPHPERIYSTYPHQISGGQKQRVMIAMAMACNPAILIADEPTTALDVTVQQTILQLIQRLQAESGMSTLFITHDLGVVAELCDRVLVMYQGEIVEQGPVMDIFRDPQHPYTKGLLACRPRLDRRLHTLPTIADFVRADAGTGTSVEEMIARASVSEQDYRARQTALAQQPPLLQVKALKTYFPVRKGIFGRVSDHVKAVDAVSFDVYPGETLGLVGESGCGKTTLGRSILRLQDPTGGQVIFDGKDITAMDGTALRRIRKEMQIVFQDPYSSLNPRMTIGAAIQEPMTVHNLHGNDATRRDKVIALLERVGLQADHYQRYPHEFSGGQRQRICIARALAVEPRFIICDESVSALDVSVQAQVLNLLLELRRDFGFTYIFISHDLSVVKFMSDRMIVMNKGKIEEMGYAEDIYAAPQQAYTRSLIAAIPDGSLEALERRLGPRKPHP